MRMRELYQEQPGGGVVGFFGVGEVEGGEEVVEFFVVFGGDLDAGEDAAVVGSVVAVVEEADVSVGGELVEEAH